MQQIDTGLASLITVARYYNIPAEYHQLERAYVLEAGAIDTTMIVRAARELRLKVRAYENVSIERLPKLVFPAIIRMKNGRYIVITGLNEEKMARVDPAFSQQAQLADMKKVLAD